MLRENLTSNRFEAKSIDRKADIVLDNGAWIIACYFDMKAMTSPCEDKDILVRVVLGNHVNCYTNSFRYRDS